MSKPVFVIDSIKYDGDHYIKVTDLIEWLESWTPRRSFAPLIRDLKAQLWETDRP